MQKQVEHHFGFMHCTRCPFKFSALPKIGLKIRENKTSPLQTKVNLRTYALREREVHQKYSYRQIGTYVQLHTNLMYIHTT